MDNIELKAKISCNVTMQFIYKEISIYLEASEVRLLSILSYKEYLEFINESKPNWPLQTHDKIYKWMREAGWL